MIDGREGGREGGRMQQRNAVEEGCRGEGAVGKETVLSSPRLPLAAGRLKLHPTLKLGAATPPVLL